MKIYRFIRPYTKDGKIALPESKNRPGVYLIKEDNILVYVGYSAVNLYKTAYRHFQSWEDPRQARVTYATRLRSHDYKIRVVYCTPQQAARLEGALILKHKPRDNENDYNGFTLDSRDLNILHEYQYTPTQSDAPF